MSKFGDFITALRKNSAAQAEPAPPDAKENGLEGQAAQPEKSAGQENPKESSVNNEAAKFQGRTVNRKLIFGLAGVCITAFLVSFLSFSPSRVRTEQNTRLETSERGAQTDPKYSNMLQRERQDASGSVQQVPERNQPRGSSSTSRVQAVPSSPALPQKRSGTVMAQVPETNVKEKEREKLRAEALNAAISFSLKSNQANNERGDVGTSKIDKTAVSETAFKQAPVENSLYAGTLLPAMLMSGVSSDLGGQLMAQVTEDVYDSLYGDVLLIPMGSRLIGGYEAGAENGQSRITVKWNLLILPDGATYNMEGRLTSADNAGYPGIPGRVNNHEGKVLSGGALSSAIAALGSVAVGNTGSGGDDSAGKLAMEGAAANLLNAASALFNKNLNMKPTITVAPGAVFAVRVHQTMVLEPYQRGDDSSGK